MSRSIWAGRGLDRMMYQARLTVFLISLSGLMHVAGMPGSIPATSAWSP